MKSRHREKDPRDAVLKPNSLKPRSCKETGRDRDKDMTKKG